MILAQMPTPSLPDLPEGPSLERVRGPIELPAYETWQILAIAALAMVLAAAVIWAVIGFRRARRRKPAVTPPDVAALAAIDAAQLTDDDERFAVLLSQSIRRFLEAAHGLDNSAKTTDEFVRSADLPEAIRAQLSDFLHTCDQVKFARRPLGETGRRQLTETAKRLIKTARPEEPPA